MTFRNETDVLKFRAAAPIPPNTVMLFPGTAIPGETTNQNTADTGDKVGLQVRGRFEFPCATGVTFAVGAIVEWDEDPGTVVASGGDFTLGMALKAKTAGQITADIMLEPSLAVALDEDE